MILLLQHGTKKNVRRGETFRRTKVNTQVLHRSQRARSAPPKPGAHVPQRSRGQPDSAGNVKKADLFRMRVVERMNRLGGRLQQDRATLFRKIRLSFRR